MKTIFSISLFLLLIIQSEYMTAQDVSSTISQLSVLRSSIWAKPTCEVCWENANQGNSTEREWVRQAVARTWEANSKFRFTGWQPCSSNSQGIRINITDTRPHTNGLGNQLNGKIGGMELNFTFQNWGCMNYSKQQTPCNFPYNGYSRQQFIEIIAVHEFGHALGIGHEQNRSDCRCADEPSGTSGDWNITACDTYSVMNYCNPKWSGNGKLSSLDIEGVNVLYPKFLLQTGTAQHETNEKWDFQFADWDGDNKLDMIAIAKNGTGTKSTEVHILSGASNFKKFILQTGTGLGETDANWDFQFADWDGDRKLDMIGIAKSGTGTKSTEVHILSGASNFKNFILQTGTAQHETNYKWDFQFADWNGDRKLDMIAIAKSETGTKSTEVHILSGASNFKNFIVQTGTSLHETNTNWSFQFADWDGDRKLDMIAIAKNGTGTKSTEVHILSGASNFKNFIVQTGTGLPETNDNWAIRVGDWNNNNELDILAVAKNHTGTKTTEMHILSIK